MPLRKSEILLKNIIEKILTKTKIIEFLKTFKLKTSLDDNCGKQR
jgi:hypothetical protein